MLWEQSGALDLAELLVGPARRDVGHEAEFAAALDEGLDGDSPSVPDAAQLVDTRPGAQVRGYLVCRGQQLSGEGISFALYFHLAGGYLVVHQDMAEFVSGGEAVPVDVVCPVWCEDDDGPGQSRCRERVYAG
jgi:hypothetical protein